MLGRIAIAVSVLLIGTMVLASCGTDDGDEESTGTAAATETTAAATETTAAATETTAATNTATAADDGEPTEPTVDDGGPEDDDSATSGGDIDACALVTMD